MKRGIKLVMWLSEIVFVTEFLFQFRKRKRRRMMKTTGLLEHRRNSLTKHTRIGWISTVIFKLLNSILRSEDQICQSIMNEATSINEGENDESD